ncbi:hypothetical protein AB9F29_18990 [Falsihalocynthiibacter sp. S25ZX9]|uniref:hypothetical protein n=1 Tax=Falsihalocynthiibacter sp. S25ZX9 TaxID=3240870 RepID=UPI00351053F1
MACTTETLERDPAFAAFLSTPVGQDKKGAHVSLLSMLARLDVDPWAEASDLATLPVGAARKRLETLIATFTDVPAGAPNYDKTVATLLARMPQPAASAPTDSTGTMMPPFGAPIYKIIATVLLFGWIALLAQGY